MPSNPLSARSKQVRRDALALAYANKCSHLGGCFSCVEILIALYDRVLKPEDKFILSKGHACWPLYVLLRERGLNPTLSGHPSLDVENGINCTSGSLGHGFPIGVGMALARKITGKPGNIYVLMGDGECQEGTTWESMLLASRHDLTNLTVIVDFNGIQGSGFTADILPVDAIKTAAGSIGWTVSDVSRGHDCDVLSYFLSRRNPYSPILNVVNTVKGKGVSFMENQPRWHSAVPTPEQYAQAMNELS